MKVNGEQEIPAKSLDFETILSSDVGRVSPYQVRVVLLGAFALMLSPFSTTEYVFTTGRIPSRCLIPECESTNAVEFEPTWLANAVPFSNAGTFESCLRYANVSVTEDTAADEFCSATLFDKETVIPCEQHVYENTNTAVYDLDLGCSEWLRSLLGSARTTGQLLSLPLAGAVSDRWGRRIALTIFSFNTAVIGVMRYFVNTYIGFIVSVFLESFLGAGGTMAVAYIFIVEIVPNKYRLMTGALLNSFGSTGQSVVAVLAYVIPNWRHLTLALYAPQLLTLSYFWIFPESVRWSLSKGRYAEAETVLNKIARSCGKELSEKTLLNLRQAGIQKNIEHEQKAEKEPWLVLLVFRNKPILLRCLVAPVWWITIILIYYGLSVNAVNIAGNQYLNYILVAVVDIPGFWCGNFLISYFGRKSVIISFFLVCSLCQVAYIFLSRDMYAVSLTVYLIGKFSISAVGSTLYVYTSELFPTQYRNRLFGYCSMMGRIGSIISPLTPALGAMVWEGLPFAMFAAMAFLSGLLMMTTPETRGCQLPDTMEEAANIGQQQKTQKKK